MISTSSVYVAKCLGVLAPSSSVSSFFFFSTFFSSSSSFPLPSALKTKQQKAHLYLSGETTQGFFTDLPERWNLTYTQPHTGFNFSLRLFSVWLCVGMCIYVPVPIKAIKGCQIPEGWSYSSHPMCVLRTELWPSWPLSHLFSTMSSGFFYFLPFVIGSDNLVLDPPAASASVARIKGVSWICPVSFSIFNHL